MREPQARVLIVDDYEPWRRFATSTLRKRPEFLIVGEVADGLAAVEKAQELNPDLILLDIGLPKLNGIEAARQIRELVPNSKILFVTENRSLPIAKEALRTGAGGYFVKSDAARELLPAIRAVLQGKQFVGASLAAHDFSEVSGEHSADSAPAQKMGSIRRHEVGLYSDDSCLLDHVTQFIGTALKAGSAAVVVATESQLKSLVPRLQAHGLDIDAAIMQGRYITMDVASTVSTFIVHGMLDQARFLETWGNLILTAAKAAEEKHPRVAVYGGGAGLVWAQGNQEAAIQIEKGSNQLTKLYGVDILCGYSLGSVQDGMHSPMFQQICAEHSAVHSH